MRIITNWKTIGYSQHVRQYAAVTGIRDTAVLNTAEQLYQDLLAAGLTWSQLTTFFPFWGTNQFQNQVNFKTNQIEGTFNNITHSVSGITGGSISNFRNWASGSNARAFGVYSHLNVTSDVRNITMVSDGRTSGGVLNVRRATSTAGAAEYGAYARDNQVGNQVLVPNSLGLFMTSQVRWPNDWSPDASTSGGLWINGIKVGNRGRTTESTSYSSTSLSCSGGNRLSMFFIMRANFGAVPVGNNLENDPLVLYNAIQTAQQSLNRAV